MRAMGYAKVRIKLLYLYEALILVFSSSMLGLLIGTSVGITLSMQQALYSNTDIIFYFPWKQALFIFFLSIVCAFFSTWGPTTTLTNKQIS